MPAATLSSPLWILEPYGPVQPSALTGPVRSAWGRFGDGLLIEEGTTNLVLNPSFRVNTVGYSAVGGAIARSQARSWFGSNSLLVSLVASAAQGTGVQLGTGGAGTNIGLASSTTYTLSCWVWVPSGSPAVQLSVQGAGLVAAPVSSSASTVTNQWQRLTLTFTTIAGATTGNIYVLNAAAAVAGNSFYVDAVQVEAKAYMTSYADGNMATDWNASGNLLPTAAQQDFEDGTAGGWQNSANASLANSGAQFYAGTKSLQITAVATASTAFQSPSVLGSAAPVTPGKAYTSSAWLRTGAVRNVVPSIRWFDAAGASISIVSGAAVASVAAGWVRVAHTAIAPVNAAYASVYLTVTDLAAAEVMNVDAARFEEGTGSASYRWTGAENASTSTRTSGSVIHTVPALVPNQVSFAAIIRVSAVTVAKMAVAGSVFFGSSVTANDRFFFNLSSANQLSFTKVVGGVAVSATLVASPAAGDVLFVVGTFDGANVRLYYSKNSGVVATAATASVTVPVNQTSVTLGTDVGGANIANSPVEQALVYRSVLTATEIAAMAAATEDIDFADDHRIVYAAAAGKVRGAVAAAMASGTGHYRPSQPPVQSLREGVAPGGSDPADDNAAYALYLPAGSGVGQGALVSNTPDGSGPRYTVQRVHSLGGLYDTAWVA